MAKEDWCDGGCAPDECVCVSDKLYTAYEAERTAREAAERENAELRAHCAKLWQTLYDDGESSGHNYEVLRQIPAQSLAAIRREVWLEAARIVARVTTPATMRQGGNYTCEQEAAFDDALAKASRMLEAKARELEVE